MKHTGERKKILRTLLNDLSELVNNDSENLEGEQNVVQHSQSFPYSEKKNVIHYINVDLINRGELQPRGEIDQNELVELTDSIKSQGVLQPLIVRTIGEKQYEVIIGERRWCAAKLAGLREVPAIIRSLSDEEAAVFALIENLQRKDLNPIEEANGYQRLVTDFKLTHDDIAKQVGKSRTTITNMLRLLNLCSYVKKLIGKGQIEMGHARALLSLDEDNQRAIADTVVGKKLSVRETEKLIQDLGKPKLSKESIDQTTNVKISEWENRIAAKLCNNAKIKINNAGQGKVTIPVNSLDEVRWLVDCIEKG